MRKLILLLAIALIGSQTFCQKSISSATKENYLLKSKHQKTAAWILLGGGAAATITGLAIGTSHVFTDIASGKNHVSGEVPFYVGIGMMAASVPFFILSHKNATKYSIAFSNEHISSMVSSHIVFQSIPALKLKIHLP